VQPAHRRLSHTRQVPRSLNRSRATSGQIALNPAPVSPVSSDFDPGWRRRSASSSRDRPVRAAM
jgi:hypothetical protein